MEKENLHLLINEEIYLLPQDEIIEEETLDKAEEVQETTTVAEPEPELVAKQEKTALEDPKPASKEEPKKEHHQESPHVPHHDLPDSKPLPFAVFHTSHDHAENELLHKILDACKIPDSDYKIFSNGFDQSVKFIKALVFVPEAKAFYIPIPYKGSEFLCSKPLDQISGNVQEKAKLWAALQKFVDTI